ncbi:MAG: TIM barrel protein, partial [Gemmataceae bacterium]
MSRLLPLLLLLALPCPAADVFAPANRVAWCVVPFDAKKRGPTERVEMLKRLGFTKYAYDWRAEHLPTFADEEGLLKKAGITLQGVWFPAGVGKDGEELLRVLKTHQVKTELWVMLPQPDAKLRQDEKVKAVAAQVAALAKRAAADGHKVGVYNHGGWTGEPANMAAVVAACGEPNVGIVYNLHHGHDHLAKLADHLKEMKPHLYCLNLNGMKVDGEKTGQKILCIGEGDDDAKLLKTIRDSGYAGPVGILGHTDHDVEDRLADNLNGLDCLLRSDGFTPLYRTTGTHRIGLEAAVPNRPAAFVLPTTIREGFAATEVEKFRVYVAKPNATLNDYAAAQPLNGEAKQSGNAIRFTPRFPPQPGTSYRIFFDKKTAEFAIPMPNTPPTVIDQVYPTAGVLPENTLRMYVHFSAPVKKGDIYKHIKLVRDDGVEVASPFLELDEELWSPDGKRLTLLFYPGRVKRGLVPREEAGPILEEGKKYTLVISKDWPDEYGRPLKQEFRKAFSVVKPDDTGIDPAKWRILPANTLGPGESPFYPSMQVFFGEKKVIDHALAERLIWVVDEDGHRVDRMVGKRATDTHLFIGENLKHFPVGKYKLVIDTRLEDVC